ncbi:unnamed protein product [Owenia fusiformis]|uniref:Phosphate transporter n=1 Tax=Owenia fusiformis TaxID=6347 RepID=A0A8J1UB33_OWEFU|nr:unnamed protein product [Owenia fusiformis]
MVEIVIPNEYLWMVIVGFIVAFVLAFGLGANDVANSFGTSVGSGVLTLRTACILATIFETLGAVLIGYRVSDTIRKGIIDVELYRNQTELLMVGQVSALTGSCVWLIAATVLRLPVSGTHSIVGATIGFALVAKGASGVNWARLGLIIGSWFISPITSGAVSTGLFFVVKYFILTKENQLEIGLRFLPIFYGVTLVINLFSVFYEGSNLLGFDRIPLWGVFILSFGMGIICCLLVRFLMVPWMRRKIQKEVLYEGPGDTKSEDSKVKYTFQKSVPNSKRNSLTDGIDPKMLSLPEKITEVAHELELQEKENMEKIQNGSFDSTRNENGLNLNVNFSNGDISPQKKRCPPMSAAPLVAMLPLSVPSLYSTIARILLT